ncbi:hypothetical protein DFH09DRAFT_466914 [Mycena vulgaris]|nr:hypothetical protein DFH09DRAFT_466914 [Mycena vulgaris]
MWRLLCAGAADTDAPCETRPLSDRPYRPSRFRLRPRPPPRRGAYTHGDPIDHGQRQAPSKLGCGSGTPRRWMYRDEGCDFAARSPPPCAGRTSGFCARYISVLSRASFHGGAGRRGLACGGPLQRGALSSWAPTLRKTYAEFGVRSPSRLVARRTHAPGSGSFGGAGADVHRALPTLVHHAFIPTMYRLRLPVCPSHAMLLPQLSPSINAAPSRPRIVILPTAPSVSHRSPHSCAYACPPESRSLPLKTLLPISYLPCPAAFASTANPACLRGARSRVPSSICPRRSI